MNVPARKPDPQLKSVSNLPSLITAPEKTRVPTLDAHEFFTSSVEDVDSWSLPGLLVTGLAAVLLGASTYVALLTKHVDVPVPVAVPVTAVKKIERPKVDTGEFAETEKALAEFSQGLSQFAALYPDANLTVIQKGHKGLVLGVAESFFFTDSNTKLNSKASAFFASLNDFALASGHRFNVAIETSSVMLSDEKLDRSNYLIESKRAFDVAQSIQGDAFLQKRVRTTIQSGSSPLANPRISIRLAVSQKR